MKTKTKSTNKRTNESETPTVAPGCDGAKPLGGRDCSLFRELPAGLRARLEAIPGDRVRAMNAELVDVSKVILGAVPALKTLRGEIVEQLPRFDLESFDSLEVFALAGINVLSHWQSAVEEVDAVPALFKEADELREEFISEGQPIARRGEIKRDKVDGLIAARGYVPVATKMAALAQAIDAAWGEIGGRTGLTREKLERAKALGTELVVAVAKREALDGVRAQHTLERRRMFTLMLATYEEARRAVDYLRFHEGDADVFAPSVYGKRGATRSKAKAGEEEQGAKPAGENTGDTKQGGDEVKALPAGEKPDASEGKPAAAAKQESKAKG